MGRVGGGCARLSLAGVAAAKDGALASLDTPIPPDADPGTEIDVAWRAWMPDAGTEWPFSGSPVFIRLVSADGGRSTETMGRESPAGSGRYEATIAIPSGGVGRRRGGAVRRVVRRRHMHALRPPVRAPGGPARSRSRRQLARVGARRDRCASCRGTARDDRRDGHGPVGDLPIAVGIIAAGVAVARGGRRADASELGRPPKRPAADDTGPAGSRPRPAPVSDAWRRPRPSQLPVGPVENIGAYLPHTRCSVGANPTPKPRGGAWTPIS